MLTVRSDSDCWKFPNNCWESKCDSKLLSKILLVSKMANLFDKDSYNLQAGKYLRSIAKQFVKELQHRLEANNCTFEI